MTLYFPFRSRNTYQHPGQVGMRLRHFSSTACFKTHGVSFVPSVLELSVPPVLRSFSILAVSMQTYKYDRSPPMGREPAISNGAPVSQPVSFRRSRAFSRPRVSKSTFDLSRSHMADSKEARDSGTLRQPDRRLDRGSNTWTTSHADINLLAKEEEVEDRSWCIAEYNRLAKKYGIRPLIQADFPAIATTRSLPSRKSSWISRMMQQGSASLLKRTATDSHDQNLRHRRSISDMALHIFHRQRKDSLENNDLRSLVRLCGKSMLYLPTEYAPGSLTLPTCFRATAQYLVQHARTSGIFRIPGSVRVVHALYNYYCADMDGEDVATTTRCPNLPSHLNCGVHDVASAFKKLLAGLPGGILGSLALFDAMIAIHSQLHNYAETERTKETKLRARLIAMAIFTVKSQYQRELICAVFGLLSFVGREAEIAPREDNLSRPLPTSDLMGYGALAIVFGPLLVGDRLDSYSMKLADPASGLIILPITPYKSGKHGGLKRAKHQKPTMLTVDRILVANDITEMLLMHWKDIVRHLKNLDVIKQQMTRHPPWGEADPAQCEGSDSEVAAPISKPASIQRLLESNVETLSGPSGTRSSLSAATPTPSPKLAINKFRSTIQGQEYVTVANSRIPRPLNPSNTYRISKGNSLGALSPTTEEVLVDGEDVKQFLHDTSSTPSSKDRYHSASPADPPPVDMSLAKQLSLSDIRQNSCGSQEHSREESERNIDGQNNQETRRASHRTTDGECPNSSDSHGTIRRHLSVETSPGSDLKRVHTTRSLDKSTIKHIRKWNDGRGLPQTHLIKRNFTHLGTLSDETSGSGRGSPLPPQYDRPGEVCLDENNMLPYYKPHPHYCSSESVSLSSAEEERPFYIRIPTHESLGTTSNSGFDCTPVRPSSNASCGKVRSHESPYANNSNTSLLEHVKSPQSVQRSSVETEGARNRAEEPPSTPIRRSSAATKWKELVQNSPAVSPSELKQRRMTRNSVAALKQQLSSVSGSMFTPEIPPIQDRCHTTSLSSLSTKAKEKEKEKWKDVGKRKQSASNESVLVTRRSVSKPVTGTVKSIAARFDSVSQESPPDSLPALCGGPQSIERASRPSLLLDAESKLHDNQVPFLDKATEAPKARVIQPTIIDGEEKVLLNKVGKTPSRFRASITKLSHGLRPSVSNWQAQQILPATLKTPVPKIMNSRAARSGVSTNASMLPVHQSESDCRSFSGTISAKEEQHEAWPPIRPLASSYTVPAKSDSMSLSKRHNKALGRYGESTCHDQVDSLQSQRSLGSEERLNLHKKSVTSYDADVGRLRNQLQHAEQECKVWRERAQVAEQRVVLFEEFIARFEDVRECLENVPCLDG